MTKSMTAYGRGSIDSSDGRWVVEINSVNRKALELQVFLPRDCLHFDMSLRKWIAPFVQRGQVTIRATLQRDETAILMTTMASRLKSLKAAWLQIATDLGYDPNVVTLEFLLERMTGQGVQEKQDETKFEEGLKSAFEQAAVEWQSMREREGISLAQDILTRVAHLENALGEIENQAPKVVEDYRQKLTTRLNELFQDMEGNEERVMREAVVVAERADITEEIIRLRSHFSQMKLILASHEKGIGRTMEFLVQEMHREVNTLSAKSADLAISKLTVSMKAELEKIREQVQNIE